MNTLTVACWFLCYGGRKTIIFWKTRTSSRWCARLEFVLGSEGKHVHIASVGTRCSVVLFRLLPLCGPGSSVGMATGYGLDGPGIE
jgi:hypothetical protein